jgi:HSP20 family protein
MATIRWEPFGRLDHLLGVSRTLWPQWAEEERVNRAAWRPNADISETEKEFLIRAELPAVRKEDVKVTFDAGIVTIHGERKCEPGEQRETYHRVESVYGKFSRSFSLPENVAADGIRCESRDGVLTVRIPKVQPEIRQPRQIPVQ